MQHFLACLRASGTSTIAGAASEVKDNINPSNSNFTTTVTDWDAWHLLDTGGKGDCGSLTNLAVACLGVLGIPATGPLLSYPTDDNPATASSCKTQRVDTKSLKHELCQNILTVNVKLIYPGNNFEGFFTVSIPHILAFTVAPPDGPFQNQTYYYLEVLRSVASQQQWVTTQQYECPTCKNNFPTDSTKYVIPITQVGGNIPVPSIP
ncbi:MAG: hypothetical protein LBE12_08755 [Planctomycetaceae bacterium]|nr:hypothetical protein [Planctomycetaceae bacterium]